MSLDDRIAAARERAERTLDPDDFKVLRALEAVETAGLCVAPEPASTEGIGPWSEVSRAESGEADAD